MAFFISHVLSSQGSISAQEPHGYEKLHVMIFLSYASTMEQNNRFIIDPVTCSQIEVQRVKSSQTSDPTFSTLDMKSFYHMPQQRRKIFQYGRIDNKNKKKSTLYNV